MTCSAQCLVQICLCEKYVVCYQFNAIIWVLAPRPQLARDRYTPLVGMGFQVTVTMT